MTKPKLFNTSMTQEEFLRDYWNKKPCLFKNAFPEAAGLACTEELEQLALEEDFETRIVYKDESLKRKMEHGPFQEARLRELKSSPFALICHNLNTLAPEFYELEESVDFIPKWEFDDVMAVYSNKDMSLGAHIDNYNVFILQGQGSRRWEIQENPRVSWRSDEEIKVLERFEPDYAWDLGPGDMIYVPPGVAHHGVSLEDSVSYSIGFKALETVDALGEFMACMKESSTPSTFYKNQSFNEISKSDVGDGLMNFLRGELSAILSDTGTFRPWLMKKLSAPKFPIEPSGDKAPESYQGLALQRDVHLKYSVMPREEESFLVCVNEIPWDLDQERLELLLPILNSNPFETFETSPEQERRLKEILDALFDSGCIFIHDGSEDQD